MERLFGESFLPTGEEEEEIVEDEESGDKLTKAFLGRTNNPLFE